MWRILGSARGLQPGDRWSADGACDCGDFWDRARGSFIRCRTHWIRGFTASERLGIRGFMAFQLAWRTQTVLLMVPVWPESGLREGAARLRPLAALSSSSMNAASPPG